MINTISSIAIEASGLKGHINFCIATEKPSKFTTMIASAPKMTTAELRHVSVRISALI